MHNHHEEDLMLARAYIKIQHYNQRWEPMEGLMKGTIFPELYRPYPARREAETPSRNHYQVNYANRASFTPVRGGRNVGSR